MNNIYYDYPKAKSSDAYDDHEISVHEEHLNGGVLVYIERLSLNDKRQIIDRQIEVAGYRHTPYVGRRKIKIIPEQNRASIKSSLTKLLKETLRDKVITDFFFWA
jgi:hypothetical protein